MGRSLTELQNAARKGVLMRAMKGYLEWLAPQMDKLPDVLGESFLRYRDLARNQLPKSHARSAGAVAHLMIGYEYLLRYIAHLAPDTYNPDVLNAELKNGWKAIISNTEKQADAVKDQTPTMMYLTAISSLLESGTVKVERVGPGAIGAERSDDNKPSIGYKSDREYYLIADAVYMRVCEMFGRSGRDFPLSQRTIQSALAEEGISRVSKGRTLLNSTINGKTANRLCIPVRYIDGEARQEQTELGGEVYTEVVGEQTPFD